MSPKLIGLIMDLITLGLDAFLNHSSAWDDVSEVVGQANKEGRDITPAEIAAIRDKRRASLGAVGQALHQRELRERQEKADKEAKQAAEAAAEKAAAEKAAAEKAAAEKAAAARPRVTTSGTRS